MKQTSLPSLNPASARKKISTAKSDKRFVAALLDRDHRGHRDAVEQWTRLHQAAFPEPDSLVAGRSNRRGAEEPIRVLGFAFRGSEYSNGGSSEALAAKAARPFKTRLQGTGGAGQGRPPGAGSGDRPVINMEVDRIQILLDDAPAQFEIEDNPDADPNFGAWRSLHRLGWNAVGRHQAIIEREAEAQGIDADLVKAIMYVENAQSLDSQAAEATGFGESESLLPMNIRPDPWAAIEDPPADLTDPATNIRIAVTLIRRIAERIDDPTPAKVASVWNFTGRELVNDFGARVKDAYERRLWALPVVPTPDLDLSP